MLFFGEKLTGKRIVQGAHPGNHNHNHNNEHVVNKCPNNLRILYFNVRSLYPKFDELCAQCDIEKPDVICLTETWLCADIIESECTIPGYKCIRCDRNRHGGGVAVYISENLEFQVIMCGPSGLEFLLVSVHNVNNAHRKLYIGVWYRPPANNTALDDLYSVLESLDPTVLSNFVLLGDFNIDFYNHNHPLFCKLSSFLHSFELTQVVSQPTCINPSGNSTLIDLVLLSAPSQLVSCNVIPPLGNSDHNGIHLTLKRFWNPSPVKTQKRNVWRYSHAHFDKANALINANDWTFLDNESDMDTLWSMWEERFMGIMEQYIPKATISPRRNLPWMNKHIRAKIKKRNVAYRKGRKTGCPSVWNKYRTLRNQVVSMLRQSKRDHLKKMSSQGSKHFWKTVKFLNKKSCQIPTLKKGSDVMTSNTDKAACLNEVFSLNFNSAVPSLTEDDSHKFLVDFETIPPENILCTEDEVLTLLLAIDTSKASGPDGISGKMLKNTAVSISPILTKLFNLSLSSGKIPHKWKVSSVVPIPKSTANTENPCNYRPISLLSIVSKLLEKHVYSVVLEHFTEREMLTKDQWGFTPGKSTVTALVSSFYEILQLLESGADVSFVFFDLSKVFDSVPHLPLLQKLSDCGLDQHILQWILYYLCGREQYVVVDGASSKTTPVVSGVPQGSVLGPLLFLVYINCVSSLPLTTGSRLTIYADDILLFKPIYLSQDYEALQKDIDAIAECTKASHLTLNPAKCRYLIASRKRQSILPPGGLLLDNCALEQVHSYRYLGVLVTSTLTWKEHIKQICTKARKLVGMLYRKFSTWADTDTLRCLYLTCIRPHLEYICLPIMGPLHN